MAMSCMASSSDERPPEPSTQKKAAEPYRCRAEVPFVIDVVSPDWFSSAEYADFLRRTALKEEPTWDFFEADSTPASSTRSEPRRGSKDAASSSSSTKSAEARGEEFAARQRLEIQRRIEDAARAAVERAEANAAAELQERKRQELQAAIAHAIRREEERAESVRRAKADAEVQELLDKTATAALEAARQRTNASTASASGGGGDEASGLSHAAAGSGWSTSSVQEIQGSGDEPMSAIDAGAGSWHPHAAHLLSVDAPQGAATLPNGSRPSQSASTALGSGAPEAPAAEMTLHERIKAAMAEAQARAQESAARQHAQTYGYAAAPATYQASPPVAQTYKGPFALPSAPSFCKQMLVVKCLCVEN
eukprot:TRINITY_DN23894_c0_g1_i1.p1 TRINITY_DN23894_c0_g1~~TRINITY_DN23894_c0_g1_i1.p1  ORF type:complete len:364 (-),score=82.57 TRINITY_DN23894_c0_g1_i1:34-1125(-)